MHSAAFQHTKKQFLYTHCDLCNRKITLAFLVEGVCFYRWGCDAAGKRNKRGWRRCFSFKDPFMHTLTHTFGI